VHTVKTEPEVVTSVAEQWGPKYSAWTAMSAMGSY